MVRVNLGNNQEGRSNLAKNFVYRQQKKKDRVWLIKLAGEFGGGSYIASCKLLSFCIDL